MNELHPIEREIIPELTRVEQYLDTTARLLEQRYAPDEVTISIEGVDLAHNYQFPSRLAMVGDNYSTLDAQARLVGLDETNARVEGFRVCLYHYNLPISTTIELEEFDEATPLADIPFAVIPSGCDKPTGKITLDDLLSIVDDLVQKKQYDLSSMLDPRIIHDVSFGQIVVEMLNSIEETAKRKRSRRKYETHEPIITEDGGFVGERSIALDIMHDTKETESYRLYVGVRQDMGTDEVASDASGDNTVHYGIAFHHRPSTEVSAIRPVRGEEHTFHPELKIEATDTPATKDLLSTFEKALDELRIAKELGAN